MPKPLEILLVEDNPDDEHLTVRALRRLETPVDIHVVRDGQQALDALFQEAAPLPSVILLDLKLPKVSGAEVLARLRSDERTKDIAVIVLSSADEPADVRSGYESMADRTMQKPVSSEEFTRIVSSLGL